jgi:alpha-galactosidase
MDRRHFIQLSSASLASLIFTPAGATASPLIRPPQKVEIQRAKRWISLQPSGGSMWTFQDVQVRLDHTQDGLPVLIQSPTLDIEAVRLSWTFESPNGSTYLGDHWERSYGDLSWRAASSLHKAPWYVLVYDGRLTRCFGVQTGCRTICWWDLNDSALRLTLDTRSGGNGVLLDERKLLAANILTSESEYGESPFATARRFCRQMCPKPVLPTQPVYGINDWYFAYGNNSKDLILQHTSLLTDLATNSTNRPFSVVDAGWAKKSPLAEQDCCWGDDFSRSNDRFGDMSVLAKNIKALGMRPGLWVRPLSAPHDLPKYMLMPSIKGREDITAPILDPTIPENLQRIKGLVSLYQQWGYELVKHDYSSFDIFGRWGFQMAEDLTESNWHFHDSSRTNAEIILQLYQTIREGAGSLTLIGCNTMSHLSAGFFELNRIGDDTSGQQWQRTRKMGVNTLGFRIVQHQAFYATDADCVGITPKIPWRLNKQWMNLVAQSGTPLFISAQPDAVGAEQKADIKNSFAHAALVQPVGEPLDWLTNPLPASWKLNNSRVQFDWQ